ncbi:hypothetical protein KTQ74_17755, partial [Pseudomonas chlororaphis]|uniref:hypothetical protein n=1 Tax=Pseudomonas chlororaphis TaxID=587753 RepID=UPI001E2EABA0
SWLASDDDLKVAAHPVDLSPASRLLRGRGACVATTFRPGVAAPAAPAKQLLLNPWQALSSELDPTNETYEKRVEHQLSINIKSIKIKRIVKLKNRLKLLARSLLKPL